MMGAPPLEDLPDIRPGDTVRKDRGTVVWTVIQIERSYEWATALLRSPGRRDDHAKTHHLVVLDRDPVSVRQTPPWSDWYLAIIMDSYGREVAEQVQREADIREQRRLLDASVAMMATLGIRVDIWPDAKMDCDVYCERGRGKTTWFVTIDSDLPIDRQISYLQHAWALLLPVNDGRWLEGWKRDKDDAQIEWRRFNWAKDRDLA